MPNLKGCSKPEQRIFGSIAPKVIWCHDVWWTFVLHRLICFAQNPLSVLSNKGMSTVLQKSIVPQGLRHDCRGRKYSAGPVWASTPSFVTIKLNKLSLCPQCAGKTVKTVMASSFPSIPAATTPTRLVLLQIIAYIQALGIHFLSPAPSVFNSNFVDDVASTVATEPDFIKDWLYNDFFKMLGFFYGDVVGLECASGLCSDQCHGGIGVCIWALFWPARHSKWDEFNKAEQAQLAPAASEPSLAL